jgi:hypothetical protein
VPQERENDAGRLGSALHQRISESAEGPVRRRLRELGGVEGGVEAIVVGGFTEHSADLHELTLTSLQLQGGTRLRRNVCCRLTEPRAQRTKALLCAAFAASSSSWSARAQAGGGDALERTRRREEERTRVGTEAAILYRVWPARLPLMMGSVVDR